MQNVTIPTMALRGSVTLAIVLGIALWTGSADSLMGIHIGIGIIAVLSLWWLSYSALQINSGLAIGGFVLGLLIALLGINQTALLSGSAHWVVQVVHAALGISAAGLGEVIGARSKRAATQQA